MARDKRRKRNKKKEVKKPANIDSNYKEITLASSRKVIVTITIIIIIII
jgi:hypothetical protein